MNSQKIILLIRKLFNRKPGNRPDVNELNHWYASLNESEVKPDRLNELKTESWHFILSQIELKKEKREQDKILRSSKWFWKAAIFLGLSLISLGLFNQFQSSENEFVSEAAFYSNDIGRVTTFFLPDGSQVWLSTGSTLEIEKDFIHNRQVTLIGEAFFNVKPNPEYPFQITTGDLSTQVLGTSFNLKAYDSHRTVELSVYSGKVSFFDREKEGEASHLVEGEQIFWSHTTGMGNIELFNAKILPDWRHGKITFKNAYLAEIQSMLKRWYKVEITIEGEKENCRYSGEFNQASLEQILETLRYALDINYEIKESHVTIHSLPCKTKNR